MQEKVGPSLPPEACFSIRPAMKRSMSSTLLYTELSAEICSSVISSDRSVKSDATLNPHTSLLKLKEMTRLGVDKVKPKGGFGGFGVWGTLSFGD